MLELDQDMDEQNTNTQEVAIMIKYMLGEWNIARNEKTNNQKG